MFDLAEKLVEREITERLSVAVNNKAFEFANKLLKRNTPIEIIVEDTGLDESTIKQLQAEMNQQL